MSSNNKDSMFSANDIKNILTAISNINHVFTETITLHKFTKTRCTSCEYDPIRNASVDVNCPTCGGTGWIQTDNPSTIQASADYEGDFDTNPLLTAQDFDSNIVYITLDIKELNTLNQDNAFNLTDVVQLEHFLKQYDYITWDNTNYELISFQPGWLEGILYETALKMRRIIV